MIFFQRILGGSDFFYHLVSELKKSTFVLNPEAEARALVSILFGSFIQFLQQKQVILSDEQKETLTKALEQRMQGCPLAYVVGFVQFCQLKVQVKAPILIPRPETEEWVQNLISEFCHVAHLPLKVLDLGTGSGCISLALAKAFGNWQVLGLDLNPEAVSLANLNKEQLNLSNVSFLQSNWFAAVSNQKFDLIVSNPPYIAHSDERVQSSVSQWESPLALYADQDGLQEYQTILSQADKFLTNRLIEYNLARIVMELGADQARPLMKMARELGLVNLKFAKDFADVVRVIKIF